MTDDPMVIGLLALADAFRRIRETKAWVRESCRRDGLSWEVTEMVIDNVEVALLAGDFPLAPRVSAGEE